jgi:hypothetical protein
MEYLGCVGGGFLVPIRCCCHRYYFGRVFKNVAVDGWLCATVVSIDCSWSAKDQGHVTAGYKLRSEIERVRLSQPVKHKQRGP